MHNNDVNTFKRTLQLAMLQTKRAELDKQIELQAAILFGPITEDDREWIYANLDDIC